MTKEIAPRGTPLRQAAEESPRRASSANSDSQAEAALDGLTGCDGSGDILLGYDSFSANKGAPAHVAADEAFGFKLGVGICDGGAVNAQLSGEFAAGGNALAGAQISAMNQGANLVAQLDVERNVTLGLQMQWNHWLIQSGQSIVSFSGVKSQFVFSFVGRASACLGLSRDIFVGSEKQTGWKPVDSGK